MMSNGYNKIIANRSICKCTYSKHNFGARISNWEILFCVMGNKHWYIQVGAKTFDYSLNILTTSSAIITNENSSLFSSFFKNFYDGLSGFPM